MENEGEMDSFEGGFSESGATPAVGSIREEKPVSNVRKRKTGVYELQTNRMTQEIQSPTGYLEDMPLD